MNTITQNYSMSHQNLFVSRISKSDSKDQEQVNTLSDKEVLQEVNNFNSMVNIRVAASYLDDEFDFPFCFVPLGYLGSSIGRSLDETGAMSFYLEAELKIQTPTQAEYEKAKDFIKKQADKIMAEIARENYDLMSAAKLSKASHSDFINAIESNVLSEKVLDFVDIMETYGIVNRRYGKGYREEYQYSKREAEIIAINYNRYDMDEAINFGCEFFSLVSDRLSESEKNEILEAIAKVRVYEEENGVQIRNIFLKYNAETGYWDYTMLETLNKSYQSEALIASYSHFNSQTMLEMLENKDKAQSGGRAILEDSTDSLMQTLLRDSKKNVAHQNS